MKFVTVEFPHSSKRQFVGIGLGVALAAALALLVVIWAVAIHDDGGQKAAAVASRSVGAVPVRESQARDARSRRSQTGVPEPDKVYYLVGSAEQAESLRMAMADVDQIRAGLGLVPLAMEPVVIASSEDLQAFETSLRGEIVGRQEARLPNVRVIDLRPKPASQIEIPPSDDPNLTP
jgi:hypothetical protein